MVSAGEIGGIWTPSSAVFAPTWRRQSQTQREDQRRHDLPDQHRDCCGRRDSSLLIFVIPVFADIVFQFWQSLPLPTQIAINLSYATIAYAKYLLAAIGGTVFGVRSFIARKKADFSIDGLMLKLPIFGDLIRKQQ